MTTLINHLIYNLGGALFRRFERFGRVEDVETAVSVYQKAAELMPDDHPAKPNLLSNLVSALSRRFERFGRLEDIETAISVYQKAAELTPDEHRDKPTLLNNFGGALSRRFEQFGRLEDVGTAISVYKKVVELTPDDHPDKPSRLCNLGGALSRRFERFGRVEDVETAISVRHKAAELMPDDHRDKPSLLSNLGNALLWRIERFGRVEDIETAISVFQKAEELTPDDHRDKPSLLSNLGGALLRRFGQFGRVKDVETAISVYQKAIELTPDDYRDKPSRLNNLGSAHLTHYRHLPDPNHLNHAHLVFSEAANSPLGPPHHLFIAARNWAECETLLSRSPLPAFSRALQLLPRIAWFGLSVTDQHALLAQVGDVVREAVTAAIQHDEYEMAVEWTEQGRSIVWQNLLNLRTPVDQLAESHPELANRLRTISRQIDMSTSHDSGFNQPDKLGLEEVARKHRELSIERDKLIDTIRAIPEFKSFMSPKPFYELASAAHEGPVVVLNVHESRCDALVLISSDANVSAVVIPLEEFSYDTSKKLLEELKNLLRSSGVRSRDFLRAIRDGTDSHDVTFKNILSVLWRQVVKPVIDALAYQVSSVHYSRQGAYSAFH
jgi:tetratricopeptide (TPR) repeat protein